MNRSNKNTPTSSAIPLILIAAGIVLILIVLIWQLYASQSYAIGASTGQPTLSGDIPYPEIARASLPDALEAFNAKTAIFIDVRSAGSYDQGHIAGAISLPLARLEGQAPQIDRDAWIIPYCT